MMSSQEACPRVPGVALSAWRCGAHCGLGAQQCPRQGDLSPSLTHGCGSAVMRGPLFYPPAKAQGLCAYVCSVSLRKHSYGYMSHPAAPSGNPDPAHCQCVAV